MPLHAIAVQSAFVLDEDRFNREGSTNLTLWDDQVGFGLVVAIYSSSKSAGTSP